MKKNQKYIMTILIILIFLIPSISSINSKPMDIDPYVDIYITLDILKIRSLEHDDPQLDFEEIIDEDSNPDFYIVVDITTINGSIAVNQQYISDIFWNTKYIYDSPYSLTINVPDDSEIVDIVIQLWDSADGGMQNDRLCDISPDNGNDDDAYDVEITYNVRTGRWSGDDALKDASGYGRLNGCDDGTIYSMDRDCELWFTITQNDYDNDLIPYYMETEVYGTDPMVDDSDLDIDNDGIPTWWEWKYEYNPIVWDDFSVDIDNDGLTTLHEYITSQWFSDPYTRDIFLELDQMADGPNNMISEFPNGAKELLYTAYDRQNVVYHLDDGTWVGETGSEDVPFDPVTDFGELRQIYTDYFLHGDENNPRKEIFHYGVLIYRSNFVQGMAFGPNRFQISAGLLEKIQIEEKGFDRDVSYASCYMHETGHTLGFNPIPGHGKWGWLLRLTLPLYKSCMSYGWMYRMVDYSDGSRPHLGPFIGDYDDWERMDLTYFLKNW